MPQVEVDETQLQVLQRNSELLAKALSNPKARDQLLKALKVAVPELPIPELDAKEPVMEELQKLREEISGVRGELSASEAKRLEERTQSELSARWSKGRELAQKEGYVGESLEALEKFMEERGVADHEIAIAAFERLHPNPKPVEPTSRRWKLFEAPSEENKSMDEYLKGGAASEGLFESAVGEELRRIRGLAA